jgi:hypothetical protein
LDYIQGKKLIHQCRNKVKIHQTYLESTIKYNLGTFSGVEVATQPKISGSTGNNGLDII